MSAEERVRAATRARAAQVTDIRPLDLPAVPASAPRARRWVTWATRPRRPRGVQRGAPRVLRGPARRSQTGSPR